MNCSWMHMAQSPVLFCTWHPTLFLEFPIVTSSHRAGLSRTTFPRTACHRIASDLSSMSLALSPDLSTHSVCVFSSCYSSYSGAFHCLLRRRIPSLLELTEKHLCFTECRQHSSLAPSASQPNLGALPLPVGVRPSYYSGEFWRKGRESNLSFVFVF